MVNNFNEFIYFIRSIWSEWIGLVSSIYIKVSGINVSLWWLLIGFLIVGFCITAFWKGAKA